MSPPVDEDGAIEYITTLAQLELEGARASLVAGPYTAFTLVGAIQLATRHPEIGDELKRILREFGDQIVQGYFGGTPGQALLEAGWDPPGDTGTVP